MDSPYSLAVSLLAVGISSLTLWLTFLRRGEVKMTKPAVIFFGPDGLDKKRGSKVFLRTLLYSTSKRGTVLENLYVTVHRGETRQNFNIWVYGETKNLVRGSGLYIGNEGVATNHHFLTPPDIEFAFSAGEYRIEVFAKAVGEKHKLLSTTTLHIDAHEAKSLKDNDTGIYFDWGPDAGCYHKHIDLRPKEPKLDPLALLEALQTSPIKEGI